MLSSSEDGSNLNITIILETLTSQLLKGLGTEEKLSRTPPEGRHLVIDPAPAIPVTDIMAVPTDIEQSTRELPEMSNRI